jgi:hypothetical protein
LSTAHDFITSFKSEISNLQFSSHPEEIPFIHIFGRTTGPALYRPIELPLGLVFTQFLQHARIIDGKEAGITAISRARPRHNRPIIARQTAGQQRFLLAENEMIRRQARVWPGFALHSWHILIWRTGHL